MSVLVLHAHPNTPPSRVNAALAAAARSVPGVTVHDLYEAYPHFFVDVRREQARVEAHDTLVFQHPMYWYSAPPLLKQWWDTVLEEGWAYGRDACATLGKTWTHALTTAGTRAFDTIDERNAVIVAGAGRFGQIVARLLLGRGMTVTVIDHDPNQIDLMRRFAFRGFYGDASRPDVLASAGAAEARLLVLAIDDPETVRRTVEHCRVHYPQLALIARARGRVDAYALTALGVPAVRETFGSALETAELALRALGQGAFQARSIVHRFRQHDEAQFAEQMAAQGDVEALKALARSSRAQLERLLADDAEDIAAARRAGKDTDW